MDASIDFGGVLKGSIADGDEVIITPVVTSGTKIADISVNGVEKDLYCPTPPAPTEVDITPVVTSGTKIADVSVNGVEKDLYCPTPPAPTGELGQMTKVGTKFNFGSQNTTLRIGRVMQCTLVITVTSAISDGETFIKLPKAMCIPCIFLLANDAGTSYKVGNTNSNSDQLKALYGSGLPAGNYRGSFMYLTVE